MVKMVSLTSEKREIMRKLQSKERVKEGTMECMCRREIGEEVRTVADVEN